jgi:hypothetical protein
MHEQGATYSRANDRYAGDESERQNHQRMLLIFFQNVLVVVAVKIQDWIEREIHTFYCVKQIPT